MTSHLNDVCCKFGRYANNKRCRRPRLDQLRSRVPGFVRRLHSYYGGVRLLMIVHHRLRLLASPTRTSAARMLALADHEISRFPSRERAHMPVSKTTPGRLGARVIAPIRVAFRRRNDVGTQDEGTFAAQWLAYALPCQRFANLRMTRGRCGSLLVHRDGLAPSTPCRSSRRTPVYPRQRTSSVRPVRSEKCQL